MDKDQRHLITGKLKTIEKNKLRKRFSNGLTYRENIIVDYQKTKDSIIMGINSCIQSWCDKHGVTTSSIPEWKQTIYLPE